MSLKEGKANQGSPPFQNPSFIHPFIEYDNYTYRSRGRRFGDGEWEFLIKERKIGLVRWLTLYVYQYRVSVKK